MGLGKRVTMRGAQEGVQAVMGMSMTCRLETGTWLVEGRFLGRSQANSLLCGAELVIRIARAAY